MPVVVDLDGRIDAELDRLFNNGTVLARDAQGHVLTRRDIIGQPEDIGDLCAVKAQGLSGDSLRELKRKDAHSDEVRAMNALETLGHDGFHAKKARALGSPVAAGAGSVFLTGEDDERNSVSLVGHAGVVDKRRLSIRWP